MKTKTFVVSTDVELSWDENSPEFQEALKSFNEVIWSEGDSNDMLKQIANQVAQYGHDRMVEGIGYVQLKGQARKDPWCGVEVESGYDDFSVTEEY